MMGFLAQLKDKNKFIGGLVRWYKSIWFPVVYAILGVFAATFGFYVYLPVFYFYAISIVALVLFCDDLQPLLVPVMIVPFAIGGDGLLNFGDATSDVTTMFEPAAFVQLIICLAIVAVSVIFKLIQSGGLKAAITGRGVFTFGVMALGIAFIFNGIFSPRWQPMDILYGLMEGVGLVVAYFIAFSIADKKEDKRFIPYVCKLATILALMISFELVGLMIKLYISGDLFILGEAGQIIDLNKDYFVLGWGVANPVAAVLVFLLPFMFYIAYSFRNGTFVFIPMAIVGVMIFLLKARTALIVAAVVFIVGLIICCTGGRNRVYNRFVLAIVCGIGLVLLGFILQQAGGASGIIDKIFNFIRFDEGDNGRFTRWQDGWNDFLTSPVFGVGFADGGISAEEIAANDFIYYIMYHNILIQIIGSTGIVGAFGFIWHLKDILKMTFYHCSRERLILALIPAAVLAGSLLDNFFYYFNVMLIYGVSLIMLQLNMEEWRRAELAERAKPITHEGKVKVCFTFIEAGMGHVIPEAAICDVFEKKYGKKVEVIRSKIYSDTHDVDLCAVQDGYVRNVKMQNRSAIYGKFCMLMNKVGGNYLSREYVIGTINHGRKANKKAVEILNDIKPDVLFTTHWASAYYVSKMKDHRPYTIMLCPDAYSNGMFDIDVNNFLMTNEQGAAKIRNKRMYAGGNITVVPYPIRQEAFQYVGKRKSIRKELGIAENAFVVMLADGGYGAAKLVETVTKLVQCEQEITILAMCGTNDEGKKTLESLPHSSKVDLRVFGYTREILKLMAASDLFVGKSGANSMAEPTFYGIPTIITKCITPIETGIMRYYVNEVKNAIYIPDSSKAVEAICNFRNNPELLKPYAENAKKIHKHYGAEAVADLIYEAAKMKADSFSK